MVGRRWRFNGANILAGHRARLSRAYRRQAGSAHFWRLHPGTAVRLSARRRLTRIARRIISIAACGTGFANRQWLQRQARQFQSAARLLGHPANQVPDEPGHGEPGRAWNEPGTARGRCEKPGRTRPGTRSPRNRDADSIQIDRRRTRSPAPGGRAAGRQDSQVSGFPQAPDRQPRRGPWRTQRARRPRRGDRGMLDRGPGPTDRRAIIRFPRTALDPRPLPAQKMAPRRGHQSRTGGPAKANSTGGPGATRGLSAPLPIPLRPGPHRPSRPGCSRRPSAPACRPRQSPLRSPPGDARPRTCSRPRRSRASS